MDISQLLPSYANMEQIASVGDYFHENSKACTKKSSSPVNVFAVNACFFSFVVSGVIPFLL